MAHAYTPTTEPSDSIGCHRTPMLTIANFPTAVCRLAIATDAELAEWDRRLPAAMEQDAHERSWNGRRRGMAA